MKNLISMTDFVFLMRENKQKDNIRRFWACERYAKFLKQPLILGMVIPCDEYGNTIELIQRGDASEHDRVVNQNLFNEAKERCLFEGFVKSKVTDFDFQNDFMLFRLQDFENIESLLLNVHKINIQPTPTAIKMIGL